MFVPIATVMYGMWNYTEHAQTKQLFYYICFNIRLSGTIRVLFSAILRRVVLYVFILLLQDGGNAFFTKVFIHPLAYTAPYLKGQ